MAKWITADIILLACISFSVSVSGQTIRLVSPLNNGVGRIEVFHDGTWGTVCDDDFGADEAKVACKQLGRYKSGLTPRAIQSFGFGGGQILLDDVNCSGTETSLDSCSHRPWGVNDCSHGEDVGIICDPSDITMKLKPGYHEGLLQVYHSGRWGTVCDDGFGQIEASVVCRALGYQGGKVINGSSSITMWLDDVQCTTRNTDLKDCKHRPWGSDDCSDSEAVGVQCFSFPEDSTVARLVSTTNTSGEGVLELYHGGQWGRVCYTGFGVEEATVVCRMLGHSTIGALASFHFNFGSSSRHIILDKVHCIGTEHSLNECLHYPWGSVTCSSIVVRIQCPSADIQIRLNSTTRGRGRVEVLHNNVWGTVCRGSSFSSQEAQVVCKMANLPWTTAYVTTSYGPGEGIIGLSNVDCTGTETSLDQCSHSGWGTAPNCSHSCDVGVVCRGVQVSSLIGSDDTTSQDTPIAIVTGSVGIVTIIILIIIIIHLRRKLHAAKPEHEPQRSEQTSRADEIPARCCNYESMERPSEGAEITYCEVGLSQTTDGNPAHVYGNTGFEDEENIRQKKGTASGNIQLEMSEVKKGKERKVRSPKGQAYNDDGNPAHVYGNTGFEDEENIRQKKGTASATNYGNIQLEMSENIRQKRGKERKVRSPKGQAYNDEPVYQNTTSRNQSSM